MMICESGKIDDTIDVDSTDNIYILIIFIGIILITVGIMLMYIEKYFFQRHNLVYDVLSEFCN